MKTNKAERHVIGGIVKKACELKKGISNVRQQILEFGAKNDIDVGFLNNLKDETPLYQCNVLQKELSSLMEALIDSIEDNNCSRCGFDNSRYKAICISGDGAFQTFIKIGDIRSRYEICVLSQKATNDEIDCLVGCCNKIFTMDELIAAKEDTNA